MIVGLARRRYRHLTPRYVVDRVRLMAYEQRHPDAPWLTVEAVTFLERRLPRDGIGFEWGSGRSTVWFAQRLRQLISVEHDPYWYDEVKRRLEQKGVAHKVTLRCVPIDDGAAVHPHYVAAISDQEDGALDFCLIDGVPALRAHCALACLPKLRTGGIAIVDNANWFLPRGPRSPAPNSRSSADGYASAQWQKFARQVADWPCIWTSNGVYDTALWTKSA